MEEKQAGYHPGIERLKGSTCSRNPPLMTSVHVNVLILFSVRFKPAEACQQKQPFIGTQSISDNSII